MSEFHVHVVRVGKIGTHPNADSLGITHVIGRVILKLHGQGYLLRKGG